jgi:hypothetical protein
VDLLAHPPPPATASASDPSGAAVVPHGLGVLTGPDRNER